MRHILMLTASASLALASLAPSQELTLCKSRIATGGRAEVRVTGALEAVIDNGLANCTTSVRVGRSNVALGKVARPGLYPLTLRAANGSRTYLLLAVREGRGLRLSLHGAKPAEKPDELQQAMAAMRKLQLWAAKDGVLAREAMNVGGDFLTDNAVGLTGTFVVCTSAIAIQPLVVVCAKKALSGVADYALALGKHLVKVCPKLDARERKILTALVEAADLVKTVALADDQLELAVGLAKEVGSKLSTERRDRLAVTAFGQLLEKTYVLIKKTK